ncbi:protein ENHANCED DOWNY MILDEW 2-like [Oryza brachyantha]|nr:protein ENHANCED DOWNY MILDEW 2-like [Oryza brachyantha]
MMSSDDDLEPQLKAVENYYFVDDNDVPVSFDVLPFQFDAAEEVASFKKDVYLRGFTDGGLQKVYKQVVAWKLVLDGDLPEITVLSTEGSWIALLKPRPSYEETIRSVLITVEMLHFARRRPMDSEKDLWDHLHGVFERFEVGPSEDDFTDNQNLIKLYAQRDSDFTNSQVFQVFVKDKIMKNISEVASNNLGVKQERDVKQELGVKQDWDVKQELGVKQELDIKQEQDIKQELVADVNEMDEMIEEDSTYVPNNDDDEEDEEDGDLFDSVCAICDNGGELLCCEGSCMRSFHAKIRDGEDSYCATLGYTKAEVKAIKNFVCKNCEHKQHQCFVCGALEPSDGTNAKVFLCNNATCGHFYHPKCVAQLLHPNNMNEASELEKNIMVGFSFTCPVHWCFSCKGLEDRTQEPLQFAVCRRCPRSYHRKCLPREISFEDNDAEGIITRAWELSKRILIYCLDHEIDLDIGTPPRDHLRFPHVAKTAYSVKKKVKELAEKKRQIFDDSNVHEPLQKRKLNEKFNAKSDRAKKAGVKTSFEGHVFESEKKKTKYLKEATLPEASLVECVAAASNSRDQHMKELEKELGTSSLMGKIPQSSFPIVDSETEKRVLALVEKEVSSLTLADISRRCAIPSTYASSGQQIDKIIVRGKLERSIQAVKAALQKLETGGAVDDAKAVCESEVLRQLTRWHNKLRVYLAPFIHGMRYTSFGRHFTKNEKLVEIVEKLHWYVQPGDMIVDFACGTNDFSQFMKEKLDKVGKRCNFKNYDVIQPKNSFNFEKRDWMTVRQKELPHGSKLIIGLNPPFGSKAMLANKFIDKALTFKPKLIILIVPKEAERLDRKKQPYDLVWEDEQRLSGKSFYLPGSLDVSDKQIDQWNKYPPPLCLWSRADWTQKHKRIAEQHGHFSHTDEELVYVCEDQSTKNHDVYNKQKSTSGKGKEAHFNGNKNFAAGKPVQADGFPPEKLVEVAYEETKVVSNRSDMYQADQIGVHDEERDAHSDLMISRYNSMRAKEVSNSSRDKRKSDNTGHGVKGDSDMSISPPDSRNYQHKSSNREPPLSSRSVHTTSERLGYHDNCFNHLVQEHSASSLQMSTFEDSYFRPVNEYGVASVENNVAFSTDNGPRMYSPDLELTGLYASDPTGNAYGAVSGGIGGSFYRRQDLQDHALGSSDSAHVNPVPGREMQENARIYYGHMDELPQTSMNTPSMDIRTQIRMYGAGHIRDDPDIRAQIRMYGRYSGSDHQHASRYSSRSPDAIASRFEQPALTSYGMPTLGSTGRSVIDRYGPPIDETNYRTGQRGPYSAPDFRRDRHPDTQNFAASSHKQHPYPPPGSSGGWHD